MRSADPDPGDFLIAADDALIAAQNAVTAAQSFGIGSCYIGDIMENYEIQRGILALPEYVVPAALVVFGYPTKQQKQRAKPERTDLRYIVHENTYHRLNEEELRSALGKQEHARSYDAWIRAFFARKYDSGFAREINRSAAVFRLRTLLWPERKILFRGFLRLTLFSGTLPSNGHSYCSGMLQVLRLRWFRHI